MSSLQYCQECHQEHPLETSRGIPVAYCERRIIENFNNKPLQSIFNHARPARTVVYSHARGSIKQQSSPAQHTNQMPIIKMPITLNTPQHSPILKQQPILRDISNASSSHNVNRIAQNPKIVEVNKKQQRRKQMQLTANKVDWHTPKSMLSTIKEDNGQSQRSYSLVTATATPRISSKTTSLDFRHPQPTQRHTIYHQKYVCAGQGEGECTKRAWRKPKRLYVLSGLQRREQSSHDAVIHEQRCCCL